MIESDHEFHVRVRQAAAGVVRAYARAQSFEIGSQASVREADPSPSAVEYALGALGGDLVCGLERAAASQGVRLHAVEVTLIGRLDNVLVQLGVVGEQGHAGFGAIDGTIYISTDGEPAAIESAWQTTLVRSPLYNTFTRSAAVSIILKVIP